MTTDTFPPNSSMPGESRRQRARFSSQDEMRWPVKLFFADRGYEIAHDEYYTHGYHVDMLFVNSANNRTVAVELSIADPRRAFEQALAYGLFADQSYVAIPDTLAASIDVELFRISRVGLIAVSPYHRCRIVIPAGITF